MPVFHLNKKNLSDVGKINNFLNGDNESFVLIYRNGCPPCMKTHPEWLKLKNNYNVNENIGVFDIEEDMLDNINHSKLKLGIQGVPTMRYINNSLCEDYEDCDGISTDRSYESFIDWINHKTNKSMTGGDIPPPPGNIPPSPGNNNNISSVNTNTIPCSNPRPTTADMIASMERRRNNNNSQNGGIKKKNKRTKKRKSKRFRKSKKTMKKRNKHSSKTKKWSLKYKRSINCHRPKGFSQHQYCKRINRK